MDNWWTRKESRWITYHYHTLLRIHTYVFRPNHKKKIKASFNSKQTRWIFPSPSPIAPLIGWGRCSCGSLPPEPLRAAAARPALGGSAEAALGLGRDGGGVSATDASLGGGAAGDPLCRWGWGGFLGLGGGYFLYLFICSLLSLFFFLFDTRRLGGFRLAGGSLSILVSPINFLSAIHHPTISAIV